MDQQNDITLELETFTSRGLLKILDDLKQGENSWERENDPLTLVEDSWGIIEQEPYGKLTERAKALLTRGQCLGFAEALAKVFGTGLVAVQSFEQDGDDLQWDEENEDFLRDENGYEIPETYREIYHAYAVAPDGSLWDVHGAHSAKNVSSQAIGFNPSLDQLAIDEAYERYGSRMPGQNKLYAESLVIPVLREALSK